MIDKSFEITLDTEKELYQGSIPLFNVSRNDFETVELLFTINQDDQRVDLTDCTVEMAVKKPSGLTVYQQCDVTNAAGGEAIATLSIQGYVEYGIHTAEVYVRTGNQLAVTCPFYYASREAIMVAEADAIESVNDWSSLQTALFAYDKKPLITMGFPTDTPEYIGQMAFDKLNRLSYIATDLTSASWLLMGGSGDGGGGNDTILGSGVPTGLPVRIGQLYVDTTTVPTGIYMAGGATANDWERLDNNDLTAAVAWGDVTGKPTTFTPNLADPGLTAALGGKAATNHTHTAAQITDFAAGVSANIPAAYLTDTEADARYIVQGNEAAPAWGTVTGVLSDQTDLNDALAAKADDADLAGYAPINHTHTIANVTGLQPALDAKADDSDLAGYAPLVHTHTIANVTGLQSVLDGKADDADLASYAPVNHTHTIANVTGLQPALDAKADDTDLAGKANTVHTHAIADVTGLQPALDNKAALVDLEGYATYDMVYVKAETYNKTEVDQIAFGAGGGGAVIVEDNLASTSPTNALSANQGKILNDTKASLAHTHTAAQVTDFAAGVAANIPGTYQTTAQADAKYLTAVPPEYLTQTEGDGLYQPAGTYLTAVPPEYVTDTEANAAYAPITHTHTASQITDFAAGVAANIPAAYVTDTEANAAYAPITHTHTAANITDFASAVAANIPATYATDAEVSAAYQPKGTYLTTVPLMTGAAVGGAQVGNGLAMSGNYLMVKRGAGIGLAGDNSITVDSLNGLKLWSGIQADYDAIVTKDAATLYFIH
ncbi:MAG TPA: BppU family phage baseplate upper protein [Candidatus Saccharimonadales bacterium]|nr:BppU family phage baseplate upper protein [Candidatus Saccharimonadales bacterium]